MPHKKISSFLNYTSSLGGRTNPQTTRFFRYTLTGGLSTSFDFLLLFIFTEFLGIYYLVSAIIAYAIANTLNYSINRNWAYKGTKRKPWQGYIIFLVINFTTLLIIVVLLSILVEFFGVYYLVARIAVGVVIGILNFIANARISFLTPVFRR